MIYAMAHVNMSKGQRSFPHDSNFRALWRRWPASAMRRSGCPRPGKRCSVYGTVEVASGTIFGHHLGHDCGIIRALFGHSMKLLCGRKQRESWASGGVTPIPHIELQMPAWVL